MATKKELLERIERLESRITELENMHAKVLPYNSWEWVYPVNRGSEYADCTDNVGFYGNRQLTRNELITARLHPMPLAVDFKRIVNAPPIKADTERVSDVTLEELARLVIDGNPIQREEKVVSKRISKYTEDTTVGVTIPE